MKKTKKRKNPQDTTFRNINALKKRVTFLEDKTLLHLEYIMAIQVEVRKIAVLLTGSKRSKRK